MELMSIPIISNFTNDALTQYAQNISKKNNMPLSVVYNALDTLRKFNVLTPVKLYGFYNADNIAAYIVRGAASGKITIDFDNTITNFCDYSGGLVLLPLLHNEDTLKVKNGDISYVIIGSETYHVLQDSSKSNFTSYRGRNLTEYMDYTEHFKQYPEDLCTSKEVIRVLQYLQFLGLRDMSEEESKIIPENSNSITMDESTTRFSSALWFNEIQNKVIILAGIGGIGRFGNLINF